MKKIITIFISLLLIINIAGCSSSNTNRNRIKLDSTKEITSGDICDKITSIYKDVKLEVIIDPIDNSKKTLEVYVSLKKGNKSAKALSSEYNNICKNIVEKSQKVLKNYKDLTDIEFIPLVDNEQIIGFVRYDHDGEQFKLEEDTLTTESNFTESEPPEKEIDNMQNFKVTINQDSPKEVVKTYFTAWKSQDYKTMYNVAEPTWKNNKKEDVIEAWYDFKTLKSFSIQSEQKNNMEIGDKHLVMTKVITKVTYESLQGKDENKTITVNVIKEGEKWWVNPTSTLKEE